MKAKKLRPSIFLRAAELQDEQKNIFEIIREANEMRVFALLLAHEVVKDLNAKR